MMTSLKIYEMNKGGAVLKGSGLIALILTGINNSISVPSQTDKFNRSNFSLFNG